MLRHGDLRCGDNGRFFLRSPRPSSSRLMRGTHRHRVAGNGMEASSTDGDLGTELFCNPLCREVTVFRIGISDLGGGHGEYMRLDLFSSFTFHARGPKCLPRIAYTSR
jgi:hypothetical protein